MRRIWNSTSNNGEAEDQWYREREQLVARYRDYFDNNGEVVIGRNEYRFRLDMLACAVRLQPEDFEKIRIGKTEMMWALHNYQWLSRLATNVIMLRGMSPLFRGLERRQLRIGMCQWLVANDRWAEPWISLLNQELPGRMPSQAALRRYHVKASAKKADTFVDDAALNAMIDDILKILTAQALPPTEVGLLTILAGYALALASEDRPGMRRRIRMRALIEIADSTYPAHPAWRSVIDRYFAAE